MQTKLLTVLYFIFMIGIFGCKGPDADRVAELNDMPELWRSEILIADPDMPDMDAIVPLYDSYDPSLAQRWEKDKFTEDYIPESLMAFESDSYRDKPREVTIGLGDTVSVLECKENNANKEICLIRTDDNTYVWLYSFHLNDEDGERMASFE